MCMLYGSRFAHLCRRGLRLSPLCCDFVASFSFPSLSSCSVTSLSFRLSAFLSFITSAFATDRSATAATGAEATGAEATGAAATGAAVTGDTAATGAEATGAKLQGQRRVSGEQTLRQRRLRGECSCTAQDFSFCGLRPWRAAWPSRLQLVARETRCEERG
jgi:hypothetical protein